MNALTPAKHLHASARWAPAALAACLLAIAPPATAQIKRWVDEQGVVHYSDAPPTRTAPGTKVENIAPTPPLSAADKAAADARLQQYRDTLAQPAHPAASAASAPATPQARTPTPRPDDQSCAAQWQRYNAAYACMDGYRIKGAKGAAVRPEAFDKCPVVAQPSCPAP